MSPFLGAGVDLDLVYWIDVGSRTRAGCETGVGARGPRPGTEVGGSSGLGRTSTYPESPTPSLTV